VEKRRKTHKRLKRGEVNTPVTSVKVQVQMCVPVLLEDKTTETKFINNKITEAIDTVDSYIK